MFHPNVPYVPYVPTIELRSFLSRSSLPRPRQRPSYTAAPGIPLPAAAKMEDWAHGAHEAVEAGKNIWKNDEETIIFVFFVSCWWENDDEPICSSVDFGKKINWTDLSTKPHTPKRWSAGVLVQMVGRICHEVDHGHLAKRQCRTWMFKNIKKWEVKEQLEKI